MPIIFYLLLFILFAVSLRFRKDDVFLDRKSSNVIKGFFILLIVFTHILNAFPYDGFMSTPLAWFRSILGQLCVSMFFFLSGYGILYSVEEKGDIYSKSIFTNRFLRILFYTIIALIPFFIYSACLGTNHSVYDYFLSIIGLSSFGNSSWFLFAILVCYFLCSVVYLFNYNNKYIPVIIISCGVIAYIFIMYFLGEPHYKWDTIVCFVYGMIIAIFKEKVNKFLSKKWPLFIFLVVSIAVVIVLQCVVILKPEYLPVIFEMWFVNAFFCLFFVCLTKIFVLTSRILSYLGKASYSIFIMHMFVINSFVDLGSISNEWFNYLVLFIASPLVGIPIYYVYKIMDKYVTDPIVDCNRCLILRNKTSE